MLDRSLARLTTAVLLAVPSSALAQSVSLSAKVSTGRVAGWWALLAIQAVVVVALVYAVARRLGKEGARFATLGLVMSVLTLALGVATVVMVNTEPVLQHRFLAQDTLDLIELLGYAEIALAIGAGLLCFYAEQVNQAFAAPERIVQVDELPPPVEPARRSLRRPEKR